MNVPDRSAPALRFRMPFGTLLGKGLTAGYEQHWYRQSAHWHGQLHPHWPHLLPWLFPAVILTHLFCALSQNHSYNSSAVSDSVKIGVHQKPLLESELSLCEREAMIKPNPHAQAGETCGQLSGRRRNEPSCQASPSVLVLMMRSK
jgi:hypothetical protein